MIGWVKSLLTRVDPQKIFDTTAKGLDVLGFTKEERAENAKELWRIQLEFAQKQADSNGTSSKARRTLAFMVSVPFLAGKTASMIMVLCDVVEKSKIVNDYADGLGIYFGGVMTFYFGTYLYQKMAGGSKAKG